MLKNSGPHIERQIVIDIKNGSREAFTELFRRYVDKIYRGCLCSHLSHEDAEETCQDVFLKIWENRATLDETKSINAYIFTISKNIILKRIRKQAYLVILQKYWQDASPQVSQSTEEEIDYSDLKKLVRVFINQMPAKQREIFLLRLNQGLSNDEIAVQMKLSKRTVENQIYRALKKMKGLLYDQTPG